MKRTYRFVSLFAAASLLSTLAFADHDKDKDKDKDKSADRGRPSASASADVKRAGKDDDGDDEDEGDGGKGVAGRRTAAQLSFRKEVWERREKHIEERVHRGGKKMSDAEREAVKKHWLAIGKLLRIRELAQEDKNDAVVKRVDALLEKMEKNFDAKLDKLEKSDGGAK